MKLRLLTEVYEDLSTAADWYDAQGLEIGTIFEDSIYNAFEKIASRPKACPVVHLDFRRRLLKRFPYAIYYRIREHEIVVVLILHLARDPELLQRLLRDRGSSS